MERVTKTTLKFVAFKGREQPLWPCFNRYRVVDGFIRPAPGSSYFEIDLAAKAAEPPYLKLTQIVQDISFTLEGGLNRDATENEVARLLDWCGANGLLGLLQHKTLVAHFEPFWGAPIAGECPQILQPSAVHSGGEWCLNLAQKSAPGAAPGKPGTPVRDRNVAALFPAAGLVTRQLTGEPARFEPIALWYRYFPRARRPWLFRRVPLGKLAINYAEPLSEFVYAAVLLKEAVASMAATVKDRVRPQSTSVPAEEGLDSLAALVAPVGLECMARLEGRMQQPWRASTQLAALTVHAFEDALDEELRTCRACLKAFITTSGRWYCDDTCQHRENKRVVRENKKKGRAPPNRGG